MGLFSKAAESGTYQLIKPNLAEKDGSLHVVMAGSYNTWTTTKFHCNESYTQEIDAVLQGSRRTATRSWAFSTSPWQTAPDSAPSPSRR